MVAEKQAWHDRLSDNQKAVLTCFIDCAEKRGQAVYLVGGAVRDMMMGACAEDLDFTVRSGALGFLHDVQRSLGSGTVIELGDAENDTARLVSRGVTADVTGFRSGAVCIEEDLVLRDFTINSMAVSVHDLLRPQDGFDVIDPTDGCEDLEQKLIRACPGCFDDDPLRLLRAYRFSAQLGFRIDGRTEREIEKKASLLSGIAAERIGYECDVIMASPRAHAAVNAMQGTGLLQVLVPELYAGLHVIQPPFHHLDVMAHNLQTLDYAERIIADPDAFFPGCESADFTAAAGKDNATELKWAALLHDIGKPATREIDEQREGRITFYNHDEYGADLVQEIGERLRWSSCRQKRVAALVRMHMHPFHLTNVLLRGGTLSTRARLKLCRRAGSDLTLLFMLAMADSLAGQGPEKPQEIESMLASMFTELTDFYKVSVQPVIQGPKLLTGHDLIATFGLEPGPLIGDLLEAVETAAVEGRITTRSDALDWVENELTKR